MGRTHPRTMGGFLGRADDMLNVRGVTLFPTAVEDAVRRVERDRRGISDHHYPRAGTGRADRAGRAASLGRQGAARGIGAAGRTGDHFAVRAAARGADYPSGSLPKTETKARRVKDPAQQEPCSARNEEAFGLKTIVCHTSTADLFIAIKDAREHIRAGSECRGRLPERVVRVPVRFARW